MTPFNLTEFKAGRKALTRDGREATFIAHDPTRGLPWRLIASVSTSDMVSTYFESGSFRCNVETAVDLISMAPVKREGWVSLWRRDDGSLALGSINESEKEAAAATFHSQSNQRVAVVRIEWEEP